MTVFFFVFTNSNKVRNDFDSIIIDADTKCLNSIRLCKYRHNFSKGRMARWDSVASTLFGLSKTYMFCYVNDDFLCFIGFLPTLVENISTGWSADLGGRQTNVFDSPPLRTSMVVTLLLRGRCVNGVSRQKKHGRHDLPPHCVCLRSWIYNNNYYGVTRFESK